MEKRFGCMGRGEGMPRRGIVLALLAVAGCSPASAERTLAEQRTSPAAAVQVVRDYYRAVEAGRMAEAADLREDGGVEDVAPFLSLQAEVAGARPAEGPPGFVYVRVPVALTGRFVTGGDYRAAGVVTLRRRPQAQRWRIHRIVVR